MFCLIFNQDGRYVVMD